LNQRIHIFIRVFLPLALLLFIGSCRPNARLKKVEYGSIQLDKKGSPADDSLSAIMILPYKQKLEKEMNEIVGYSDTVLLKGNPESLLGNLVADLVRVRANAIYYPADGSKADICLLNNGGLRTALPKGAITKGNIFELMPFENEIVILTLDGKAAWQMLQYVAGIEGAPVSGLKMGIKNRSPVNVLINGEPFNMEKNYKIVTSDYLASGGDKMSFFNNPLKKDTLHYKIRDAIIDHFTELKNKGMNVVSNLDKRIYNE